MDFMTSAARARRRIDDKDFSSFGDWLTNNWVARTVKNLGGTISGDNQRDLQAKQAQAALVAYERERNSAREAMDFSASEAQKNRDWQEMMSNTAHQRQMADLKQAGLNPILAATGGAPVGGGSAGQGFSVSAHQAAVSTENQAIEMMKAFAALLGSAGKLVQAGASAGAGAG